MRLARSAGFIIGVRQVLELSQQRLQTFDVVGVTDCLEALLARLCTFFNWPCAADRERTELAISQALHMKPHGVKPGGLMAREGIAFFEAARQNASVQRDVAVAARCDRQLYEYATRRTGLPSPVPPEIKVDRALCERAPFLGLNGKGLLEQSHSGALLPISNNQQARFFTDVRYLKSALAGRLV